MKNSIWLLLLVLMSCTPNKENQLENKTAKFGAFNLDSLNTRHLSEIEDLENQFWKKIDSLNKLLAEEKIRTASEFNYLDFENFIKVHNDIPNDSIRLLGAERYGDDPDQHIFTFIDYNKNSIFHKQLLNLYRFDYNRSNKTSSVNSALLNGHWLEIKNIGGDDFVFFIEKSEFMSIGFTISDTKLISYNNMEESGGTAIKISDIKAFDNMININDGQYIMYSYESNPDVYICNNEGYKSFIIHQSHLNKYPIIVQDSHDLGATSQINFIEPK
ncbi:hypothetical protein [Marinigracilibium pacificum]|uniref:Lipoprotein n=1 Tax=Marinigracilibium pacificum TaxID=2729599 RepID=A0A848IWJ6_9BACT|nr:hypothetical protein [Marinigracilibium pacificum]NMM48893.1 hypothetical protein [Marinigracilibium pacificum]